jgi:hypothetical protein
MPLLEVGLDQVLKVLDQLSPDDLAVVQERLEARRKQVVGVSAVPDDVFALSFDNYLALSERDREAVHLRAYEEHQQWIDTELERRCAEWMLVCGGEVIEASPTLDDYPPPEKLMRIGAERGCVPFVFVREPLVEESAWSSLPGEDWYPTLYLTLAALGTATCDVPATGVSLAADLDTGSPGLFVDFDHQISALCVHDWAHSPWCQINPRREALAGRNTLQKFPLRIELNGRTRTTRVLEVPVREERR